FASSRSGGSPQMPAPVMRIAPKPMRRTVRSPPTSMVPEAAAELESVIGRRVSGDGIGPELPAVPGRVLDEDHAHVTAVEHLRRGARGCQLRFDARSIVAELDGRVGPRVRAMVGIEAEVDL